jgi:hypothetical protein
VVSALSFNWRRLALTTLSSLSLVVAGCAGSSVSDSLERSLEADPQLQDQLLFDDEAAEAETTPSRDTEAAPNLEDESGQGNTSSSPAPQPGEPAFVGPVPPADWGQSAAESPDFSNTSPASTLLEDVPADLKPYVQDWLALGVLDEASRESNTTISDVPFKPNQAITRGEYAHWLLTANNEFYADQSTKRIRPGAASSKPAFQDVPTTHPYYPAIQGLAEAGIIPSALTGNSTAITFRPNDPLTRENLVLWKVPLDTRTALPTATVEAVKGTWGFQDVSQIEPLALRAVLADRQNGDFANILRAFGYTTLFQPKKAVSQAEAAAALWRFGTQTEGVSAADTLRRSQAPAPESSEPVSSPPN